MENILEETKSLKNNIAENTQKLKITKRFGNL